MKRVIFLWVVGLCCTAHAQTVVNRDPEIEQMVKEVNADSLQVYIRAMVAFKTRSTVSSVTDGKTGIGAARNWVLAKFNQFAAGSGGAYAGDYQPRVAAQGYTTATNIELPYSKDNYFFAVQAVSGAGNESLPVVPLPGR